ncbi:hypothetical protein EDB83DRAFT_2676497 [Lactarius deliciosus]|nr:hypothetical protein EDB83DRAFT_2676497 [Lactarius deliciosus]
MLWSAEDELWKLAKGQVTTQLAQGGGPVGLFPGAHLVRANPTTTRTKKRTFDDDRDVKRVLRSSGSGQSLRRSQQTPSLSDFFPQIFELSEVRSSIAFPSTPHSRAALATRTQRIPNPGGHSYVVLRRAEACATVSDHLRPTDPIPVPDLAALTRSFSTSTPTRPGSPRTHIRQLAFRGGLRDRLRRFTP